jgi:TPR repeat protein
MISYDDSEIDQIMWSAIEFSHCASDFSTYLSHKPAGAAHLLEATERLKELVDTKNQAPALFPVAIKKIQALAETGNSTALFHMGKVYASGNGVEKDFTLAEYWYLKAVAGGELRAHCNLGMAYLRRDIDEDKSKGLQLLKFASDQGEMRSRAEIGMAYVTNPPNLSLIPCKPYLDVVLHAV